MEISIRNQSIVLQEYLIKGISRLKIPDTRFFLIVKYPQLDNYDLLDGIFIGKNGKPKSEEFINHIIWALRFNTIFPPTTNTGSYNIKINSNSEEMLTSLKKLGENYKNEVIFNCKYAPIYLWGFSFIWKHSKNSERKNAFKNYERLWNKEDFDDVKLWSSFVYEMVLNRINKSIYKKIHNQISREERRLFLLYYTRTSLLGYRILNQEPIIKGFLKLPDVAKLCYLYFVHRVNKIYNRDIPKFLNLCFRSYLSFYPIWNFLTNDSDPNKYLVESQGKHHVFPSDEIITRDVSTSISEDKFPFINGPSIDANRLLNFCNNFLNKQEQSILFEHLNGSSQSEIASKYQLSQQKVIRRIKTTLNKILEYAYSENFQLIDYENDIGSHSKKQLVHLLENLTETLEFSSPGAFR